ncbi:phosphoribosyltransferase [Sulfolobus sp. A20]|uniref:phosphoribosyltransferase family protein n=1 Tax=Sulfolobaceae TaxID=118883 RepID=UPI00084627D0|nr:MULTISPECIES: phosphoribosyltransferase family protein [unclassified Sulfolobus]TRM76123.1 phosphoribosyltransferase [Sulfolobus sp. A20-N-F8]TRM85990.1 phosphoribosyltransferase [Sulfolobus sp. E3]TRM86413.1 phosphoribosyltransferase [Sulfolobus sp. C3]TRM99216.1 phosphoribosyltransferase [Sulfolobus sp. F1]AOL16116.1 phosphoribosyltransferase [Sulfolobus sp. A20]
MIGKLQQMKEKELRLRLFSVDVLKELKNVYTYKELSTLFSIQESLICRYVNGRTIPSERQALDIVNKVKSKEFLYNFFIDKIKIYEDDYLDVSQLLFYPNLLRLLLEIYLMRSSIIHNVTKVVGIASNGIPFATLVSSIVEKPLVISKKYKDSVSIPYVDESIKEGNGIVSSIYIREDYISKKDKILIVDDVIRSGKTLQALYNLAKKVNAKVSGALIIATNTDEWKRKFSDSDNNITVIFRI